MGHRVINILHRVMVLTAMLCIMPFVSYAYKLNVSDGYIFISDLGSTSKDGIFSFKEGVVVPDSILIDEIILTYKSSRPAKFIIENDKGATIFSHLIRIMMTKPEMKRMPPLYLSTKSGYTISHGKNTWTVTFVNPDDGCMNRLDIDTSNKSITAKSDEVDEPNEGGTPWWVWTLFAISILGNVALAGFLIKNKSENDDLWRWYFKESEKLNKCKELLGKKYGVSPKEDSVDAFVAELSDKITAIGQRLHKDGIHSGSVKFADKLVAKMEGKGKTLQAIVKKAKEECPDGDSVAVLDKVVNMLPSKLQFAQSPQPVQPQSLEISESQMNTQTIRGQMMRWAIGQIEMQGYKGLNKNGRTDEVFKLIADMLNQASSAAQAPSEAEIITAAVLDDALTEDHKKVLLRRLIDKVNAMVDQENRIDEMMDVDEFAERMAEVLRQPEDFKEIKVIEALREKNKALMSESAVMVEALHSGANSILEACKTLLNPCERKDEGKCIELENKLFSGLDELRKKMKSIGAGDNSTPADTRRAIRSLLAGEAADESSAVNTVCRYYVYSGIPAMADAARKDGIIFNRKNLTDLYLAIENVYVKFGVDLGVVSLMVKALEDGNAEELTW